MLIIDERTILLDAQRRLLADWCKLIGSRLKSGLPAIPAVTAVTATVAKKTDPLAGKKLSRREHQILACLLRGDSEKQIAVKLTISPHTVHTYVKRLHKTFDVSSRGELLARFVQM